MRIVFAGTPAVAVPSLDALHDAGHDIVAVVTREDAPLGRKRVLTPSLVAARASELGLPLVKANRLDDAVTARIAELRPELGVIVAYGGLVREPLLSTPRHGWINLHFSALPAWRGAAPVQRALINGDASIGVTVFQLVPALDAGDVWTAATETIGPDETAGQLLDRLSRSGTASVLEAVERIAAGNAEPRPQQGAESYAHKLTLEDARLDWTKDAEQIYNRFRGVTPEPGAHTTVAGARFKIHAMGRPGPRTPALEPGEFGEADGVVLVGTATEPLVLERVQPAGKAAMAAADWWRGQRGRELRAE
ncbi:methionyl-tRNA formyltransferase [Paramicrobacterium humi]|uniref:Methionyl-tRNA formyltransferase n=1 Tax=Paramicrobacterium humi TaxID=640635 RepID=A0A1H4QTU7_9MICO|nr:methionyl-tRNA formyltransferase [Microbacterium humi]SEC23080.1 methionyl-tRNA formyltransferase [Microbacterium humi]